MHTLFKKKSSIGYINRLNRFQSKKKKIIMKASIHKKS